LHVVVVVVVVIIAVDVDVDNASLVILSMAIISIRKRIDTLGHYNSTPILVKLLNTLIDVEEPLELV